jgi:DNA-binding MarR family transcriptional regulator
MNAPEKPSEEKLRRAVDAFWDALPPFWHLVRAHIRQAAVEQQGLNVEQFHILRHIRRGVVSVSDLAEAKNISRPAASQAVDALVKKGLVTRSQEARDRRYVLLTLTDSGNALLDAVFEDTRRWMMELLAGLNDEELETLVQGISALKKIRVA